MDPQPESTEDACEREWLRAQKLAAERTWFEAAHRAAMHRAAPREACNAYLLHCQSCADQQAVDHDLLARLLAEHPMHMAARAFDADALPMACDALRRYSRASRAWLATHCQAGGDASDQALALVACNGADSVLRRHKRKADDADRAPPPPLSVTDVCSALAHVRDALSPLITTYIAPHAARLVSQLYSRIQPLLPREPLAHVDRSAISIIASPLPIGAERIDDERTWRRRLGASLVDAMLAETRSLGWMHDDGTPRVPAHVDVRFHDLDEVRVGGTHYIKLRALCALASHSSPAAADVDAFIYCVLRRYQAFCSADEGSVAGAGFHAAAPAAVLRSLHTHFGVDIELFASPLNCHWPSYCSPFPDTDARFGACGSFFEHVCGIERGAFHCNPPFTEVLIGDMMAALLACLRRAQARSDSLTFVCIVPHWTEPRAAYLDALLGNSGAGAIGAHEFCRRVAVVRASQHRYVSGSQHALAQRGAEFSFAAQHDTAVVWLQTDAAHAQCAPTDERVADVVAAFAHEDV